MIRVGASASLIQLKARRGRKEEEDEEEESKDKKGHESRVRGQRSLHRLQRTNAASPFVTLCLPQSPLSPVLF